MDKALPYAWQREYFEIVPILDQGIRCQGWDGWRPNAHRPTLVNTRFALRWQNTRGEKIVHKRDSMK